MLKREAHSVRLALDAAKRGHLYRDNTMSEQRGKGTARMQGSSTSREDRLRVELNPNVADDDDAEYDKKTDCCSIYLLFMIPT